MKQKKIVSMIGALVLIINAAAIITGCIQTGDEQAVNIIEFDFSTIKCQNANSSPYTDITSGSQIQENDKLYFEAILPAGKVAENWYVNDVKQEDKTDSAMSYTVKATDIVSGKLKVSVTFKEALNGTIEFDSVTIKCQNTNSYPYKDITNGSTIQKNDALSFEAIVPADKAVGAWYINDKQISENSWLMLYTVKASDIVGGKLKISVVYKYIRGTIEFDSSTISCDGLYNGSYIKENDRLTFKAILPTDKAVGDWYINDVKQIYQTDSIMYYTVKAADIVGGKFKVSVVFK